MLCFVFVVVAERRRNQGGILAAAIVGSTMVMIRQTVTMRWRRTVGAGGSPRTSQGLCGLATRCETPHHQLWRMIVRRRMKMRKTRRMSKSNKLMMMGRMGMMRRRVMMRTWMRSLVRGMRSLMMMMWSTIHGGLVQGVPQGV
jgi:hypothetical protein